MISLTSRDKTLASNNRQLLTINIDCPILGRRGQWRGLAGILDDNEVLSGEHVLAALPREEFEAVKSGHC